jgi:hypothetical protein
MSVGVKVKLFTIDNVIVDIFFAAETCARSLIVEFLTFAEVHSAWYGNAFTDRRGRHLQ